VIGCLDDERGLVFDLIGGSKIPIAHFKVIFIIKRLLLFMGWNVSLFVGMGISAK